MSKHAWLIGSVVLFLAGCQSAESTLSPNGGLPKPAYYAEISGWSVNNRPLMVRVYGNGDDVVLLMAGIHGNEAAGVPLLEKLGHELMARPELLVGRTVVILPVVNPDGVKANKRRNANGVDLQLPGRQL
jgi:predicted deacylase